MDGFTRAIGEGLTGFVANAFGAVGGVLRGMVGTLTDTIPLPLLLVLVGGGLTAAAWSLARR